MIGERVGVIRPTTTTDRYNNTTRTYGESPTHYIEGCAFDPGGSVEQGGDRAAVVTSPTLYLPPGADLATADRVVVRGDVLEVDGKPAVWRNPYVDREAGVVAKLKEVVG